MKNNIQSRGKRERKSYVNFIKRNALWAAPILLMIFFTPWSPSIDLALARWVYASEGFYSNAFFDFLYRFGTYPADAVCGITGACFAFTYIYPYIEHRFPQFKKIYPPLKNVRSVMLSLCLVMFIGALFISVFVLKEHWGRPRPKQVTEFGGKLDFRPYYLPTPLKRTMPAKSFPSGHSTCGFYFLSLYFVGRRFNSRLLKILGLSVGLGFGTLLSVVRIAQGGHFLSDCLFSALLMWEVSYFVDWLIFECEPIRRRLV